MSVVKPRRTSIERSIRLLGSVLPWQRMTLRARVCEAEAGVAGAQAAIAEAAEAALATAKALREAARAELAFGRLRCPYVSARVTRRQLDEGALVRSGETPLLELQDLSRVRFAVQVPEDQVRDVVPGTRVLITLAAGDERVEAAVSRVAGALDVSTRTMLAESDLDNAAGRFLPGMYFHAEYSLETLGDALRLPGGAIHSQGESSYVLLVEAGQVLRREVTLGADDGVSVQVLSGLEGDELVVGSHLAGLRLGDAVWAVVEQGP